jgi:hypothetical protein
LEFVVPEPVHTPVAVGGVHIAAVLPFAAPVDRKPVDRISVAGDGQLSRLPPSLSQRQPLSSRLRGPTVFLPSFFLLSLFPPSI